MKSATIFLVVFMMFCLAACFSSQRSDKVVSKEELLRYIRQKEHGLLNEQQINGIHVMVQYQPASLLVAQELTGQGIRESKQLIDSLEKKYSGNYYFIIKFSKDGKEAIRQLGSFDRYSDMVSVLSFELPRFVNLTTPQRDTVELSDYFFDQTYGSSDANTVLLAFSKQKLEGKPSLQINVGECGFGTGNLRFSFKNEDLGNVPKMKYLD